MITGTTLKISVQRMICSGCGAEANASCNCGVAYQPKSVRAAAAVAVDPGKSDRAIAADIGVDHKTVAKARDATGENSPVRTGLDGKTRRMPTREQSADNPDDGVSDEQYAASQFLFVTRSVIDTGNDAIGYIKRCDFSDKSNLLEAANHVISKWQEVKNILSGRAQ